MWNEIVNSNSHLPEGDDWIHPADDADGEGNPEANLEALQVAACLFGGGSFVQFLLQQGEHEIGGVTFKQVGR